MTFPTVNDSSTYETLSYLTTHPITMPSTINSGELLVCFMTTSTSAGTGPALAGWTEVVGEYGTVGISDCYVFAKVASGSEGATESFVMDNGCRMAAITLAITSWEGTLSGVEFSADNTATDAAPDTLTLTPSWGSDDTLWVSQVSLRRGRTVSVYPYADNNTYISSGTSNGNPAMFLGSDEIAAATEDPSAATISASTDWWGITMAVQPAAGGAPTLSLPTEASITSTTVTVGCTSDDATGTLYYYISTSGTAPSASDLKDGTSSVKFGNTASVTAGLNTFAVTGLTAETTYYTYFIQNDGASDSNILESGSWATVGTTITGPATIVEGTADTADGTGLTVINALTIQINDDSYSIEQTMGTQTETTIAFTPESGVNDCVAGTPAAGVPLEPTITAAGITAYQLEIKVEE